MEVAEGGCTGWGQSRGWGVRMAVEVEGWCRAAAEIITQLNGEIYTVFTK